MARGFEVGPAADLDLVVTYRVVRRGSVDHPGITGRLTVELLEPETYELVWRSEISELMALPDQIEYQARNAIDTLWQSL